MRTWLLAFATMFYNTNPHTPDVNIFWENRYELNQVQDLANSGLNRDWCYIESAYRDEQYLMVMDRCDDWHKKVIAMDYVNLIYRRLWDYQLLQFDKQWL